MIRPASCARARDASHAQPEDTVNEWIVTTARTGTRMRSALRLGQRCKFAHDEAVNLPLEGDDQAHKLVDIRPAPGVELRLEPGPVQNYLVVVAREAHGEPLLFLPAIAPTPGLRPQAGGKIVTVPASGLRDDLHGANACFFGKLAERCLGWIFVLVDAALRHLPPGAGPLRLTRCVVTPPDPYPPLP